MVGGGPAGCAAAIALAAGGARVVLIERTGNDGVRIGETLPPEVRVPLVRLGLWERFLTAAHLPSPGILAAWGGPEPHANDFILDPYGSGWRVDRDRFDAMLATGAREAGVVVLTGTTVRGCARPAEWELALGGEELSAGFVVDATGRASGFGWMLGARRVVHDRMVALIAFAPVGDGDRRTLIEATEEGWWYSGLVPDGRLVLTFQTDPAAGLRERWADLLAAAPVTAARVGGVTVGPIGIVPANSQRSDPLAGEGWLAVGDAAAAHDPVCGLGIHWALESGIAAGEAILTGDPSALAAYARDRYNQFDRYLATRTDYYRAEDRWPDAPFWRRRR